MFKIVNILESKINKVYGFIDRRYHTFNQYQLLNNYKTIGAITYRLIFSKASYA